MPEATPTPKPRRQNVAKNGFDLGAWRADWVAIGRDSMPEATPTPKARRQNVAKNGFDLGAWRADWVAIGRDSMPEATPTPKARRQNTKKKPDSSIGESGLVLLLLCVARS